MMLCLLSKAKINVNWLWNSFYCHLAGESLVYLRRYIFRHKVKSHSFRLTFSISSSGEFQRRQALCNPSPGDKTPKIQCTPVLWNACPLADQIVHSVMKRVDPCPSILADVRLRQCSFFICCSGYGQTRPDLSTIIWLPVDVPYSYRMGKKIDFTGKHSPLQISDCKYSEL